MGEERDFDARYSSCFSDFSTKAAFGALIGAMAGGFFLRTRKYPALLGGSVGAGMAYVNCENSLNAYLNAQEQPNVCKTLKKKMEKRLACVK